MSAPICGVCWQPAAVLVIRPDSTDTWTFCARHVDSNTGSYGEPLIEPGDTVRLLGEPAYLVHLHDLQTVLVVRRWPGATPCDLCPDPVAAYRLDGTIPGPDTSYLCGDCCRHARDAADAGDTPESWYSR
ncbi:hypothetical protein [Nostocoides veronense]|uniref:Uncharacterized protein n=1 Tax=Nostocoides veronense TaxID=330836 RepID=A0ABN2LAW9_9MICO